MVPKVVLRAVLSLSGRSTGIPALSASHAYRVRHTAARINQAKGSPSTGAKPGNGNGFAADGLASDDPEEDLHQV
jgi:hypothetical protein